MVKMYPVEVVTKVISMWQPYALELTTLISEQFYACTRCYINKNFILYAIHRHKRHKIAPRSFIFVYNSRIDSFYLTDWEKLFQSIHALKNTKFIP